MQKKYTHWLMPVCLCIFFYKLQIGADINALTNSGATPLIYACQNSRFEVVASLLQLGADANRRDIQGNTALHRACENSALPEIRLLLDSRVDVTMINYDGKTACELCNDDLVKKMIIMM
jgi:ankyrin repeat protein